ncbi:MAG: nucleotidyltransferase domain-containing protein [Nitrospirota bacterium]
MILKMVKEKIYNRLASYSEITALKKIAVSLSGITGVEKVVFFGSRLRGDFKGLSDMDIMIIISDISLKDKIISILHDIELEYDVPISPVIFTGKEYEMNKRLKSSFVENIEREGLVLYDIKR